MPMWLPPYPRVPRFRSFHCHKRRSNRAGDCADPRVYLSLSLLTTPRRYVLGLRVAHYLPQAQTAGVPAQFPDDECLLRPREAATGKARVAQWQAASCRSPSELRPERLSLTTCLPVRSSRRSLRTLRVAADRRTGASARLGGRCMIARLTRLDQEKLHAL